MSSLSGSQYREFSEALLNAYSYDELERMLFFNLEKKLENIAGRGSDKRQVVFELIGEAERQGWTLKLIAAALSDNSGNEKLQLFASEFGLSPEIAFTNPEGEITSGSLKKRALQRMIDAANSPIDIALWREKLGQVEAQTCAVEINNRHKGTGFLVGPDLVMTNYHVVQSMIRDGGIANPSGLKVRFDFKRDNDGETIKSGKIYGLDQAEGLVHYSKYSSWDEKGSEENLSADNELDYVVLRLDAQPGKDSPSGNPNVDARGWVKLPTTSHDFASRPALFIVQHPTGQPMKLAMDTNAFTELNENGTRVRYRTNTDHGSSGSPCFDREWNLVALHHSGDIEKIPQWNQGIPFTKIVALLEAEKEEVLDENES